MANDFGKELKKEMQKMVKKEMPKIARNAEETLNSVAKTHRGKPVSQVKPALRRKLQSEGWKFTDSELTSYAEAISEERSFKVKPK